MACQYLVKLELNVLRLFSENFYNYYKNILINMKRDISNPT